MLKQKIIIPIFSPKKRKEIFQIRFVLYSLTMIFVVMHLVRFYPRNM